MDGTLELDIVTIMICPRLGFEATWARFLALRKSLRFRSLLVWAQTYRCIPNPGELAWVQNAPTIDNCWALH